MESKGTGSDIVSHRRISIGIDWKGVSGVST